VAKSKLEPEQREQVFVLIAKGASYEEAAAWCRSTLKVSISKQAIGLMVAKHRSERTDVSKAVARDHIARTLPADLTAADAKHAQAGRLLDLAAMACEEIPTVANFEKYAKASAAFIKFEELKRKTLGLDQPDTAFIDNVIDLAGLALAEEEAGARAAAFDDEPADAHPRAGESNGPPSDHKP